MIDLVTGYYDKFFAQIIIRKTTEEEHDIIFPICRQTKLLDVDLMQAEHMCKITKHTDKNRS